MRVAVWIALAHMAQALAPTLRESVIASQHKRCNTCNVLFSAYFAPRIAHIDRNRSNAARDNLVAVCALCDENPGAPLISCEAHKQACARTIHEQVSIGDSYYGCAREDFETARSRKKAANKLASALNKG